MHKSNEDCFYFLTSTCTKGSLCTYRHSPSSLTCNVICPAWLRGVCLDPACPLRHSTFQRPSVSNGILCFYENTVTGCLKVDCTFIHSRPRIHLRNGSIPIRPTTTNLVNKDVSKPVMTSSPPGNTSQPTQLTNTNGNLPPTTAYETSTEIPINIIEPPVSKPDTTSSAVKIEALSRRIAIAANSDQQNESKTSSDINTTSNTGLHKSTSRSVITDVPKKSQEEIAASAQARLVVNRNVVISESSCVPNRKIVQATLTSSNRIVVSSSDHYSSLSLSKEKRTNIDVNEQENNTKKLKNDDSSTVDIPFPCPTASLNSRLLLISAKEKETPTTNDTKPIRIKRDRFPAANASSETSPKATYTPINKEKISAGTFIGITFIHPICRYFNTLIILPTLFSLLNNYQTACIYVQSCTTAAMKTPGPFPYDIMAFDRVLCINPIVE